jgi:hypothetical protein
MMKKNALALILSGIFILNGLSQVRFMPMEQYYKDRAFLDFPTDSTIISRYPYQAPTFFPVLENRFYTVSDLDTNSQRNTWFGRKLFDEHFFQYQNNEYFLTIDPILNMSLGRDLRDTENKNFFHNTRGIRVTGGIGKYFGFYSTIMENQARFVDYQSDQIRLRGDYGPNSQGTIVRRNGFVSGASRTKAFKGDAFDYAFVTGGVIFRPRRDFFLTLGNSPLFVGAGHRSLFLSDNSGVAPHLRISWRISPMWSTEIVYAQHMNMIRSGISNDGTESLFDRKGFTVTYLTFQPREKIQISLFEGATWSRGTATEMKRVDRLYFNPVPLINPLILGMRNQRSNMVLGLQGVWTIFTWMHAYTQIAIDDFETIKPAFQAGIRFAEPFKIENLHALVEFNYVPETFYSHDNKRLTYTHNNMLLGHPMGAGFQEVLGRLNYEYRRFGVSVAGNLMFTSYNPQTKIYGAPVLVIQYNPSTPSENAVVAFGQVDFLYRFNKKNNMQIFASALYRQARATGGFKHETLFFNLGIRTPLFNQYFDY